MFVDDLPFTRLRKKLLAEPETGCVIIDTNQVVIAVNPAFQKFFILYNDFQIVAGDYLSEKHFASFPEKFVSDLYKVTNGEKQESFFQIDYLGEEILSFDISVKRLRKLEVNKDGTCILVHKRETQPLMPQIRQNEDFYKTLVDQSTSVYQLADASFSFIYSSAGIESILQFAPHEVHGKNIMEFVHPDDKQQVRDWLIEVRKTADKLLTCEYRVRTKQGDYIWIETNARNLLNNIKMHAIVMHFRNIQVKKVADHSLIQAEQRLLTIAQQYRRVFYHFK